MVAKRISYIVLLKVQYPQTIGMGQAPHDSCQVNVYYSDQCKVDEITAGQPEVKLVSLVPLTHSTYFGNRLPETSILPLLQL